MELFTKLGLKEIASLVGTMGKSTDELYLQDTVEVDGKVYAYEKVGNKVTITDRDGNKVAVGIDYREKVGKDDHNRDVIYMHHEVDIRYQFPNEEGISLYNEIGLPAGYESFENVQRHDLMSGLRMKYLDKEGKPVASTSLGLERICLNGSNTMYEFTSEGINVGNRTITLDGNTLVSVGGMEAPDLQKLKDFKLKQEQAKIEKFISTTPDLHPFTVEALQDASRKLDRKERYVKDIIDYYDQDLGKVKEAISIRTKIMDGVQQTVIPPEVIEIVNRNIAKKVRENQGQDSAGYGTR